MQASKSLKYDGAVHLTLLTTDRGHGDWLLTPSRGRREPEVDQSPRVGGSVHEIDEPLGAQIDIGLVT